MSSIELKDMVTKSREEIETAIGGKESEYPYELNLFLTDEIISKLGIDKLPNPGANGALMGRFIIESASIDKTENEIRKSMRLQIIKLGIGIDEMDISQEIRSKRVDKNNDGPPEASTLKPLFSD